MRRRFGGDASEVAGWVRSLPGPQRATCEVGPTGFGLSVSCPTRAVACVVVAPSKLQRPSGDRAKSDVRDAERLARLLRMDTRQDLMAARHRLSKLLLRHGFVYADGAAWTRQHDAWLRSHRGGDLAFTTAFDPHYEAVVQAVARRDRLDEAIGRMAADSQFTPLVDRVGCLRGIG